MPPIRILIVDDNLRFLETLRRFLARPTLQVVGAAITGGEALGEAARTHPDLVLMDIAMPEMSGLEATRLLKAQTDPPRVIILTFHDQPEYAAEAVAAGADRLVTKAEMDTQLLPAIRTLFANLDLSDSTRPLEHQSSPASLDRS
jgi:DNA-binding NarL/FixJ family response regulator